MGVFLSLDHLFLLRTAIIGNRLIPPRTLTLALIWNEKRAISGDAIPSVIKLTNPIEYSDVAYQRVLLALMLQLLGRAEQTMERWGKQVRREGRHLVAADATFQHRYWENDLFLNVGITELQTKVILLHVKMWDNFKVDSTAIAEFLSFCVILTFAYTALKPISIYVFPNSVRLLHLWKAHTYDVPTSHWKTNLPKVVTRVRVIMTFISCICVCLLWNQINFQPFFCPLLQRWNTWCL